MTTYRVPLEKAGLEKAGVDCSLMPEEWEDIVDYAKRYLNLVQEILLNFGGNSKMPLMPASG